MAQWQGISDVSGAGMNARTDSMISDFQSAVASGDTQQITVELEALEAYYARLWEFHDLLEQSMSRASEGNTHAHEIGLTDDDSGLAPGTKPRIDGVINAVYTARHIASRADHQGLGQSLSSLRNQVTRNLVSVYDSYSAYLESDAAGSDELNRSSPQA